MAENWRQKTIEVQPAIDALIKKYTSDGIDEITTREEGYMIAQATLALALNAGLNATGGTRRKKRRAAGPLFDKLLNSVAVIFMLGYDQAKAEDAQGDSKSFETCAKCEQAATHRADGWAETGQDEGPVYMALCAHHAGILAEMCRTETDDQLYEYTGLVSVAPPVPLEDGHAQ